MKNLTIEKRNEEVSNVKSTIKYIISTSKTKQETVNRLSDILSKEIQVGFGGSHIWAANKNNERLFIITGY